MSDNNVIKDKYDLGESESKSITKNSEEIRLDLDLRINYKNKTGAIIKGTVKDIYELPIAGALVKLMTDDYKPIIQTVTNEDGSYILSRVPISMQMKLFAGIKGKKLQDGVLIAPKTVESIFIDFILEDDPSSKFGIISGHVLDLNNKEPIAEAMIYLFYKQLDKDIIKAVIYTNEYGQFVFRDVSVGQYLIRITSTKYKLFIDEVKLVRNSEIISLDIFLEKKPSLHSGGVISGVIKDKSENIVPNANVILYRVEVNKDDFPVNFTTTNNEGVYYFNNIPKGNYKIKSTEINLIDIDELIQQQGGVSPSFYKFEISEATSKIPKKFNILDGTFSDNNTITNLNGFAQGIGGPDNNFIEITINVPSNAIYKIGIQYLSAYVSRTLKFDVNGKVYSSFLVCARTDSWNSVDANVFYIAIKLQEGQNKIKFYNDTGEYAPTLGEISFTLYSKINEIYATDAVLGGGANITDSPGRNFVKGLDSNLGYVEFKFTSCVRRSYDLNIQYLSKDQEAKLTMDINGKNIGKEYTFPKTQTWSVNYSKIYTIPINLEEGANTIKFYNSSQTKAPWIGMLSYKAKSITDYISATEGNLENGAELVLNSTMVGGLTKGGKVTIDIETKVRGDYILIIQCTSNNRTVLSVEINSIRTTTFVVAKTSSNSINDSVDYLMNVKFLAGENQIQIYNSNEFEGPYIGNISWILIEPFRVSNESIYGFLYNGAKFTWNGKTVGIGGDKKGLLKLPVEVFSYGKYKVSFKYLTNSAHGAPISLYVNNELIDSYILPKTKYNSINDAKIASTMAGFDGTSDDLISFYNDIGVRTLDIGDVSFEKIISFSEDFFAEDVEVFDGAVVSEEGLILGISESLGLITFVADVAQKGKYDLAIYYVAEDDNKFCNISVNWVDLPEIISFEKTNSMNIVDIKFKVITLELVEGNNIIKIHNRG